MTERDQARQESAALRDDLDKEKDKNARLAAERDGLKAAIHNLEKIKGELEQEIEVPDKPNSSRQKYRAIKKTK